MLSIRPRRTFSLELNWLLRREKRWRWVGIALLSWLVTLYQADETLGFWRSWLVNFGTYALYWNGNLALYGYFNRRYQHRPLALARLGWLFGAYLLNCALGSLAGLAGRSVLHGPGPAPDGWAFRIFFIEDTVPMMLIMGFYESAHFLSAWRRAELRTVNLEKESAISHLEALKQQVEPHFLFNSLNTMAALVGDDEPAQDFLGAMASVYRYVLMSRNIPSVSLGQELAFVEHYLLLLAPRLSIPPEIVRDVPASWLGWHVPPIAVQLLLEHLVKYHPGQAGQPLRLTLRAADNYLSVSSPPWPDPASAQRVEAALQPVMDQYLLLTPRPVAVESRAAAFVVRLPLLPAPLADGLAKPGFTY